VLPVKYAHCMTHNLTAKKLNAIGMLKNKYVSLVNHAYPLTKKKHVKPIIVIGTQNKKKDVSLVNHAL